MVTQVYSTTKKNRGQLKLLGDVLVIRDDNDRLIARLSGDEVLVLERAAGALLSGRPSNTCQVSLASGSGLSLQLAGRPGGGAFITIGLSGSMRSAAVELREYFTIIRRFATETRRSFVTTDEIVPLGDRFNCCLSVTRINGNSALAAA